MKLQDKNKFVEEIRDKIFQELDKEEETEDYFRALSDVDELLCSLKEGRFVL